MGQIGEAGLNLIKKFEGCHLKAYRDPSGVWTIGYGHTSGVEAGQTITQEQAEQYLKDDCQKFADYVDNPKYVPVTAQLNANQRDALISFAYNCGQGSLKKLCAGRSVSKIAEKIPAYNKAGGKVSNGLVRRRAAEVELFNTPVQTVAAPSPTPASAVSGKYPCYAVCTGDGVRVRTQPSKNAPDLKSYPRLNKGNEVMELGEDNGFNKVLIADKYEGWVWGEYLAD